MQTSHFDFDFRLFKEKIPSIYQEFSQGEQLPIRSLEEGILLLEHLIPAFKYLGEQFKKQAFLVVLFERDFIPWKEFLSEDFFLETLFFEEYLFPERELLPLAQAQEIFSFFKGWFEGIAAAHQDTQELLKTNFSLKLESKGLACPCQECFGLYRSKVREGIIEKANSTVLEFSKSLFKKIQEEAKLDLSSEVFSFKKELDRLSQYSKAKMRKAGHLKIDGLIQSAIKEHLWYPSPTGKARAQLLKEELFIPYLRQNGLRVDFIDESHYERFFQQLRLDLYRTVKFLESDFKQLISSVMSLKRKDISSKILVEYLGQFWIHSKARKIKRKIIYHFGPTNSGKTYNALQRLIKSSSGCYLAPLRLLAAEQFDTLNGAGVKTSLLTGEEIIPVTEATHTSSTIEMASFQQFFDCAVIDEIQMMCDSQRGWAWTRALVNLQCPEIHVCGDKSVFELVKLVTDLCQDDFESQEYHRMTELKVETNSVALKDLKKHDAVIVFSRRNALNFKFKLEKLGHSVSIIYGMLGPEVRKEQARKFDVGETDILVSTDAISMGMNLPIKRIVFTTLSKFIESKEVDISMSEIKQISGRAGRFQRFPTGYVSCLEGVPSGLIKIESALQQNLKQGEKAMVGPDLEIFQSVNAALKMANLPELLLSEFLKLFNTMNFTHPFICVDLKEMIDQAEMVERLDREKTLSAEEIFGFTCAPVNQGIKEHVEYFLSIASSYIAKQLIPNTPVVLKKDIEYLELAIKCVEIYQWLARHFRGKFFFYDEVALKQNKMEAIELLNKLLSEKIVLKCSECKCLLPEESNFAICEKCFQKRRSRYHFLRTEKKDEVSSGKSSQKTTGKQTWRKRL